MAISLTNQIALARNGECGYGGQGAIRYEVQSRFDKGRDRFRLQHDNQRRNRPSSRVSVARHDSGTGLFCIAEGVAGKTSGAAQPIATAPIPPTK